MLPVFSWLFSSGPSFFRPAFSVAAPLYRRLTYGCQHGMSRHMRTTVRLNDHLLRQAKREARKRGRTLTSMIEEGLRLTLARFRSPHRGKRVELPVSSAGGGVAPGVDLDNSADLLDRIEGLV